MSDNRAGEVSAILFTTVMWGFVALMAAYASVENLISWRLNPAIAVFHGILVFILMMRLVPYIADLKHSAKSLALQVSVTILIIIITTAAVGLISVYLN